MKRYVELENIIEPVVTGAGCTFEGLSFSKGSRGKSQIAVYIDKEGGVTAGDCDRVIKKINFVLSAESAFGDYLLEVSSPGLDRLLFTIEQFRKYIGSVVRVSLQAKDSSTRSVKGNLSSVDEGCIFIEASGATQKFSLDDIEWARVVPSW